MFHVSFLLLCFSAFISATNICIPLQQPIIDQTQDITPLLEEIKNEIILKLLVKNEPLYVDSLDLNIPHPAIRFNGTVTNIHIYNLSRYEVCLLNLNPKQEKSDIFNITYPNLKIEGHYDITGVFGDLFDIFGKGNFWIEVTNFSIAVTVNNTKTKCFPVELTIQQIHSDFNNLMDDEELEGLINKAINNIGPESIRMIWSELANTSDTLFTIIQNVLDNDNFYTVFSTVINRNDISPYCFTSTDTPENDINVILL